MMIRNHLIQYIINVNIKSMLKNKSDRIKRYYENKFIKKYYGSVENSLRLEIIFSMIILYIKKVEKSVKEKEKYIKIFKFLFKRKTINKKKMIIY